jgi:hypothetical protein
MSAEFRADLVLGGGIGAAFDRSQQAMTVREPQFEKVFYKYQYFITTLVVFTVVVTRTKLIDLSPCQTDRPFSVHTNRDTLIEPYTALTEPRFLFDFNPSCYDGDCVWETWT